jgi:hypothetical protein
VAGIYPAGERERETMTTEELGISVAEAIRDGDRDRLESLAIYAGTYRRIVDAATAAGVDAGALEEALAAI